MGGGGRGVEFPKDSKRSYEEKPRQAGGPAWAPALFAVVFSAIRFYLAENVCGPGAQNMVGCKEFIRSRRQAMGGGVRKADGGPKTSDL